MEEKKVVPKTSFVALCPFHKEETASVIIKDGKFNCMSCGAEGEAEVTLFMETKIPLHDNESVWPKDAIGGQLIAFDYDGKEFHIGQSYDKENAQPIKCNKCGHREFNVGQGSHYTAIRCARCEIECCIHDG